MIGVANQIAEAGYDTQGRSSRDLLDFAESQVFQIAEKRKHRRRRPTGASEYSRTEPLDRIEYLSRHANLRWCDGGCRLALPI